MTRLSRRDLLARSALIGCSLAASPLVTPMSFAAAPTETRLVVIVLRGGVDGLDMVQPYGDPHWAGLRRKLAGGPEQGSLDLDGFFALHPDLMPLMPMWQAGDLGFFNAVATPYRDKRSHFDGQDLLETGTADLPSGTRDGWLNRMLQLMPRLEADTAYAIGRSDMRLLRGPAPVANWSPAADLDLSPQAKTLMSLIMAEDPELMAAFAEADALSKPAGVTNGSKGHVQIAEFAAQRLRDDARIAAFSLNGWDTHQNQRRSIAPAMGRLSDVLSTLKSELEGPVWDKTALIAMTEFGRTVRENGTGGTDHGTGGLAILAGGAIRGGQVHGDWPGLDASLYGQRDLMPTRDVRSVAAWIIHGILGINGSDLSRTVFPGVELANDPGVLL